jgi:AcrR family transcriptional regulator
VVITVEVAEGRARPSGARAAARRQAILDAAIELLKDVGYDRFTIDALAERAHAGKATIYRHWSGKAEVVVDAIRCRKGDDYSNPPDTGSLRGDLVESLIRTQETFTEEDSALIVGVVSAMHNDEELAQLMREQLFEAKQCLFDAIVGRAAKRGEPVSAAGSIVANEVCTALFINRVAMGGGPIDDAFILHVIDDVVVPLLRR